MAHRSTLQLVRAFLAAGGELGERGLLPVQPVPLAAAAADTSAHRQS